MFSRASLVQQVLFVVLLVLARPAKGFFEWTQVCRNDYACCGEVAGPCRHQETGMCKPFSNARWETCPRGHIKCGSNVCQTSCQLGDTHGACRSNLQSEGNPEPSSDASFVEWSAYMKSEWNTCYADSGRVFVTDDLHTPFPCSRCHVQNLDCTPPHLQGCPDGCDAEQQFSFDTACARGLGNAKYKNFIPKLGLLTEKAPTCMMVDNAELAGVDYKVWSDDVFSEERWEGLCTSLPDGQSSCPTGFRTCADLIPVTYTRKGGAVVKGLEKFEGKCSRADYYRGEKCGCNLDSGQLNTHTNMCNPCIGKHLGNLCLPYVDGNNNSSAHGCTGPRSYKEFESCDTIVATLASFNPTPQWERPARSTAAPPSGSRGSGCPLLPSSSQANGDGDGATGAAGPEPQPTATSIALIVLFVVGVLAGSIIFKVRRDNRRERNNWANGGGVGSGGSSADGSRTVRLMENNEHFDLTENGMLTSRNNPSWNNMKIVDTGAGDGGGGEGCGYAEGSSDRGTAPNRPQISMHTIADAQYAADDEDC